MLSNVMVVPGPPPEMFFDDLYGSLFLEVIVALWKTEMFLYRPGVHEVHLGSPHGVQKGPDRLSPAPRGLLFREDEVAFYEDVSVIL